MGRRDRQLAGANRPQARLGKDRVLLLSPSRGLGGGIERYLGSIQDALEATGGEVQRVDMLVPGRRLGMAARLLFLGRIAGELRRHPTVVLAGHPNLAALVAVVARGRGMQALVFCYGHDIWGMKRTSRWVLHRASWVRPVTISSFSAGALAGLSLQAAVLSPVVDPTWRSRLLESGGRRGRSIGCELISVFRLSEWRTKGCPVLLEAVDALRAEGWDIRLVVAGRGPVPPELVDLIHGRDHVSLVASPDDDQLAELYAHADLAVLCTQTRVRRPYSGEGFGLVLLEAQLAGTPVIVPAAGGSGDAYLPGVTGWTPVDESARTLARLLRKVLADPAGLASAGRRARTWAARATEPVEYVERVHAVVFGPADSIAARPATMLPAQPCGADAQAITEVWSKNLAGPVR